MTVNRYYSNTAVATTLSAGVSDSATSITVAATTGFPGSYPYTLILDEDEVSEEVVEVSSASSTTLTVVRGVDGTAPVAHSLGATVHHGVSARDYREPQQHIAASSGVHGLTGSVVGDIDEQTLTNKTLDGGSNTFSNVAYASLTGVAATSHTHAESDVTDLTTDLSTLTSDLSDGLALKEDLANKDQVDGYPSLDGSGLVPYAELPTGTSATTVANGDHTHSLTPDYYATTTSPSVNSGSAGPLVLMANTVSVVSGKTYLVIFQSQGHASSNGSVNVRVKYDLNAAAGTFQNSTAYAGTDSTGISAATTLSGLYTAAGTGSENLNVTVTWLSGAATASFGAGHMIVVPLTSIASD